MATVSLSGSSSFEGTTTSDPNFLSWTISLDAPATGIIDVGYRLLAGTGSVARSDSGLGDTDAYGTAESFVRFAPGETTKTVSYRLDGDNVDEVDEAVVLEMFNPEGAVLAGGAPVLRSTGFILDDDGTGNNLAAFVSRPVLVEGDSGQSQASFEVALSRPAPSAFTVSYATVDGSARAGEDYVATSGTLSFVAGQTTAGVTVPVRGDTTLEPTEMFTLDVSRPAPAAAISLGTAEILDDDAGGNAAPTVNVLGSSSFEGTTTSDPNFLSWTISLDAPATGIIDVGYRLLAGTGSVARSDSGLGDTDAYGTAESFVRFAPGETTKTVSYRLDGDNVDEVDEAVVLEMFNPEGAVLAGGAPVLRSTGFILDDDGTGNNLAAFVSRPVLVEGDSGQSQASFEVALSRPAPSAFTVSYATVDGSARAGEDYVATSGTLSFVAGQTTAGVTVPVRGDTTLEPTETFTLDVSRPAPAAAISLGTAEIRNDDTASPPPPPPPPAPPETGTSGDDRFAGTGLSERLNGFAGNDTIDGGAGNDTVDGGIGFDVLSGDGGADLLIGGNGFDTLLGGEGNDRLEGSFGNDVLRGNDGDDRLNGGLGFDLMVGGDGNDTLDALDGFDNLIGGNGNDLLNGNAGNDSLSGGSGTDRLNGGIGADILDGGADSDTMLGGNGADQLDGGTGADKLFGNAGADRIDGGAGNDLLSGGIGTDEFVFTAGNGQDTVVDFGTVDRLSLDAGLVGNAALGQFERTVGGDLALNFGGGDLLVLVGYDDLAQISGQIDLI